jgi:dTDP-4-dehydrorhamnose 3,5-epimerase
VGNCATLPHDPDEIERVDPFDNDIPCDWALRHR